MRRLLMNGSLRVSTAQRHQLAAIDHNGGASDEATGIGSEQKQRSVEVALLAEAADGDFALDGGAALARKILAIKVGHDPAGRNGIDPNALERKFERKGLGELDHAGFGGGIGDVALGNAETEHRGDIDDGAALPRSEHAPRRLLRPEEYGIKIGADDAPPFLLRHLDG